MSAQPDVSFRAGYIGGSDWTDILGIEPYGCPRRAWYEKRGTEPDYPEEVTAPMERGTALEDAVAQRYLDTEHATLTRGKAPRGDVPAWWQGHVDRRVTHPKRWPEHPRHGVLECKTANGYVYRSLLRDGLHLGYVAQAHHYLGLTGLWWCDVFVCWPDNWQFRLWTVHRDQALLESMREAGDRFMRMVEHGPAPDRLDPKAKQCKRCPFRHSCQGAALLAAVDDDGDVPKSNDAEIVALVRAEREAAEIAGEADELLEVARERLRQAIWHMPAVEVPGYRVYFRAQTTHRLDTTRLRKDQPELCSKYDREIVSRPLRVYEV